MNRSRYITTGKGHAGCISHEMNGLNDSMLIILAICPSFGVIFGHDVMSFPELSDTMDSVRIL